MPGPAPGRARDRGRPSRAFKLMKKMFEKNQQDKQITTACAFMYYYYVPVLRKVEKFHFHTAACK